MGSINMGTLEITIRTLASLERSGETFSSVLRKLNGNGGRTIRMGDEKSLVDAVIVLEASLVCDTL